MVLKRAGKRYHSITLEADAHHLMTDVWTSAGVLVGDHVDRPGKTFTQEIQHKRRTQVAAVEQSRCAGRVGGCQHLFEHGDVVVAVGEYRYG